MSWFISIAWAYATCEEREPRITKWFFSSTLGVEPGTCTFRLRSELAEVALLEQISIEHLNFYRVLPECAIRIYLYHVVDVAKLFVVYFVIKYLHSFPVFWEYQNLSVLKLTEIVILLVYVTIPFAFSLFRHFWGINFKLLRLLCLAKDQWRWLSTRYAHMVHIVNEIRFRMVYTS